MAVRYFLLLFIFTSAGLFAQNDTIVLSNSNLLVGEIKSMDQGVMVMKTKYSDSDFRIKWQEVTEIYTNRLYIISYGHGQRIQATIRTNEKDKKEVELTFGTQSKFVEKSSIVFLNPGGKSIVSRMKASFDVGITLTKANNLRQFTANSALSYTANKSFSSASVNFVLSKQDSVADISRIDADIMLQRYLKNDWFFMGQADFLSNSEQLLELRTTARAGIGYYFLRNNKLYLATYSGLAFNNESYTDHITPTKQSVEAYLATEFNKYNIGDLSLKTSVIVSPSLTESGRFRTDFKFEMKYDLPYDFYVKMSTNYNFDNQPAEGAAKDDYVFQTSFGWELK